MGACKERGPGPSPLGGAAPPQLLRPHWLWAELASTFCGCYCSPLRGHSTGRSPRVLGRDTEVVAPTWKGSVQCLVCAGVPCAVTFGVASSWGGIAGSRGKRSTNSRFCAVAFPKGQMTARPPVPVSPVRHRAVPLDFSLGNLRQLHNQRRHTACAVLESRA